MKLEHLVVAAFLIYAVVYLWRYIRRSVQGKGTGCGCGAESGCPKGDGGDSE
jgi:hypothetical protein